MKTNGRAFDWKGYAKRGQFGQNMVGDFPPSQRQLAAEFAVDKHDVENAMTILRYCKKHEASPAMPDGDVPPRAALMQQVVDGVKQFTH